MLDVLESCDPFQVLGSVVCFDAVDVVDLGQPQRVGDELEGDDAVHEVLLAVFAGRLQVSAGRQSPLDDAAAYAAHGSVRVHRVVLHHALALLGK